MDEKDRKEVLLQRRKAIIHGDLGIVEDWRLKKRINVAIIEDEISTSLDWKETLDKIGFKVDLFAIPDKFFKVDYLGIYDVVLLDILFDNSKYDGIDVAGIIFDSGVELPFVFVSALCDEKTFREALSLFPYGFLSKPVTIDNLVRATITAYELSSRDITRLGLKRLNKAIEKLRGIRNG